MAVWIIFGIALLLQIFLMLRTLRRITQLRHSIPPSPFFELLITAIPQQVLASEETNAIVEKALAGDFEKPDTTHYLLASPVRVILLRPTGKLRKFAQELTQRLNAYLLHVQENAADFSIVRDITDRHSQNLQQRIEGSLSGPAYLGLLAMLAAVIAGFFELEQMGIQLDADALQTLIPPILLAGFTGLLLTWISRYFLYRNTATKHDTQKRDFYTAIQTRLLPVSTNDLTKVLHTMREGFDRFNNTFRKNIDDFEQAMESVNKNVVLQGDFLTKMDKLDLEEVANTNLRIFGKLDSIMSEFDKFTIFVERLGQNAAIATTLAERLGKLSARAEAVDTNIEKVAQNIDNKLHLSNEMMRFLKSHFTEMDERKAIITRAVINFDNFLTKSFDQLERHSIERVIAIKDIVIREEDKLLKALRENRSGLSQLQHLEAIRQELERMNERLENQ